MRFAITHELVEGLDPDENNDKIESIHQCVLYNNQINWQEILNATTISSEEMIV